MEFVDGKMMVFWWFIETLTDGVLMFWDGE